jgi:GT2 family glycosyltransferase
MVNHRLRAKLGIGPTSPAKPEPNVKVRNKTGVAQGWGAYTLPADPNLWTPVPKTLALRLAEVPDDYEVWGKRNEVAVDLAVVRGWRLKSADIPWRRMTNWPSVHIVVPVFNSPQLFRDCLASLVRTRYSGKLTYTFVDNASTDPETLEILRSRSACVIRFRNPVGFAKAVNSGMEQVKADYYILVNQDCVIMRSDWLTRLIQWMDYRKECAICGPKLLYPDGMIQEAGIEIPRGTIGRHRYVHTSAEHEQANLYEKVAAVTGAVFCIRRKAIADGLGYLDEGFKFSTEDTAYCIRARCLGWEVWYVPESVVVHHESGVRKENKGSNRIYEWMRASEIKFHKEYGPFADLCDGPGLALVVYRWNPEDDECQWAAEVGKAFINAGMDATIYALHGISAKWAGIVPIAHINALRGCGILVVNSKAGVKATEGIEAERRFHFVKKFFDHEIECYGRPEYEIVVKHGKVATQMARIGRKAMKLKTPQDYLRGMGGAPI